MPRADPSELLELLGPDASPCRRALSDEPGIRLPPLIDHHVHLHLIDAVRLSAHGIAGVVDLGGDPVALARRPRDGMPDVAYAGAFLTAVGGYPTGRSWAPPATTREVRDPSSHPGVPGGATTAVDEQAAFGASVIKIAINSDAGPVPDAQTVTAIVDAARANDLPVVAHVQGRGTARRAIDAGVDVLAHTPFTELLDPALIARAVAGGQRWITTLFIHRDDPATLSIAGANLRAFHAAGGTVLYGTDLGNGAQPVGVNGGELAAMRAAGLHPAAIVQALIDPWPRTDRSHAVATFVPGDPPAEHDAVPAWLARATVVPAEELIHDDHH